MTNLSLTADGFGNGGHFVLGHRGIALFSRFERIKRQFTGAETNTLQLPRSAIVDPEWSQYAPDLRLVTITPYVAPQKAVPPH